MRAAQTVSAARRRSRGALRRRYRAKPGRFLPALPHPLPMFQFTVSWTELEGLRFFEALPTSEKQECAAALSPLNFNAGDLLFNEGDASDTCYILAQGEVEIVRQLPNGMGYSFGTLMRGDVFGEMCLLTTRRGQRRSASAVARTS